MAKTRQIQTSFSKGELSPLLAGSADLASYYEGASTLENWMLLRQGGITRWPGSRFIAEAKEVNSDTILWPFEFSAEDAYILEVGNLYIRIFRGKAPVMIAGVPVEIVTPFLAEDIRTIHVTQSADVLFTFHSLHAPRRLSRVSDTSWTLLFHRGEPVPSFDGDADLGVVIAVAANTGTSVPFRVAGGALLAADVGREIIMGSGRARITSHTDTSTGSCTIVDPLSQAIRLSVNPLSTTGASMTCVAHGAVVQDAISLISGPQAGQIRRVIAVVDADTLVLDAAFSVNQAGQNFNVITSSTFKLRLSPQTTLDPNKKEPVGATVTVTTGAAALRATDIGKMISVYAGIIELTKFTSASSMDGVIRSVLTESTTSDPAASPAGAWSLQEASWNATNGWPSTGDFFQGRLYAASTDAEPITFWGSASDNFNNFAIGASEEDAVNFAMASRKVNRIEWIAENNKALALGTTGAELEASGSGNDNALISGTNLPFIDRVGNNGVAPIQPVQTSSRELLYVDRSRRKIFGLGYDAEAGGNTPKELTLGAEHVTESRVKLGPLAYQARLDPRLYFTREDGQLVGLTHFPEQKVTGATRRTTQGTYQSAAVIPSPDGTSDQVWVIVKRTIDGVERKFIEMFEPTHEGLTGRAWPSLQTDCAAVISGLTGTSVSVAHLSGMAVDVVKNGVSLGEQQLVGPTLTLQEELIETDVLEVGLHYDSTAVSMEPSSKGQGVVEGIPRSWDSLWVRLYDSKGGKVNGQPLEYETDYIVRNTLYRGKLKIVGNGWDEDGRVTIAQDEPYPITVLSVFGTLSLGDHD